MLDQALTLDTTQAGITTEVVPPAHPCPICGIETHEDVVPGLYACRAHGAYLVDYEALRAGYFALIAEKHSVQTINNSVFVELERVRGELVLFGRAVADLQHQLAERR